MKDINFDKLFKKTNKLLKKAVVIKYDCTYYIKIEDKKIPYFVSFPDRYIYKNIYLYKSITNTFDVNKECFLILQIIPKNEERLILKFFEIMQCPLVYAEFLKLFSEKNMIHLNTIRCALYDHRSGKVLQKLTKDFLFLNKYSIADYICKFLSDLIIDNLFYDIDLTEIFPSFLLSITKERKKAYIHHVYTWVLYRYFDFNNIEK